MLQHVATTVSILAGVAGVLAFGLGVTRTARLRRREQTLREALGAFEVQDSSADMSIQILRELHRRVVSELVARQLTSPWRIIWPWLVWMGVVAVSAQVGYLTCAYFHDRNWSSYSDFAVAVFGDPIFPLVILAGVLGFLPEAFSSYSLTLTGRASEARSFFDGGEVRRPPQLLELQLQGHEIARRRVKRVGPGPVHTPGTEGRTSTRSRLAGLGQYALSLAPGLLAISLGLVVGQTVWTQAAGTQESRTDLVESLGSFPAWTALALSLSLTFTGVVIAGLYRELESSALPVNFPHGRPQAPTQPPAQPEPAAGASPLLPSDKTH